MGILSKALFKYGGVALPIFGALNSDSLRGSNYGIGEELASPINQAGYDAVEGGLGSGWMGLGLGLGLNVASGHYQKKALGLFKGQAEKRRAVNHMPGYTGLSQSHKMIKTKKRNIFGKFSKNKRNDSFIRQLAKTGRGGAGRAASRALSLAKWSNRVNFASMALVGIEMAMNSFSLPNPSRPYSPPKQAALGGTFNDSEEAYTQRQRALRAIQTSQYGGRSALGNESSFYHV